MHRTASVFASLLVAAALSVTAIAVVAAPWDKKNPDDERKQLQEARQAALSKLFREKPGSRDELEQAKGYAVFSNVGINVLVVSTQRGGGILRDNRDGGDSYYQMFSAGGGWGMGVKDSSVIFVFETDSALNQFESEGWDFSAQVDANLESESQGDGVETAVTAMPGTKIYQLTDAGIALQATLQGTKFWPDEDLNQQAKSRRNSWA
ncbi:MAG: YSC84-related protein [Pseudomonadota bacterium]